MQLKFQVVRSYQDDGVTLASENYYLCFTYAPYVYSFGEALGRCWELAFGFAWVVLKSLWLLITFQLPISAVGGPISTITMIASATQTNWLNLLILIPAISATCHFQSVADSCLGWVACGFHAYRMDPWQTDQTQLGKHDTFRGSVHLVWFCHYC